MKLLNRLPLCLFALIFIAGCASSTITARHEYTGPQIARPDHILVYDFAATPADMPDESSINGQYSQQGTQTAEQIAAGRQVGAIIAQQLVEEIRAMGLPAERASYQTPPQLGDLVLRGYLLSINEGSAAERVAIGFGSGASDLKTMVEGYLMTARGLRKLGSGSLDSGGSKSPGAALGVVGTIATANPAGLVISSGMKIYGEASGSSKIEGRAKDNAKEIAEMLRVKFQQQGWI